jgi:hypothetical protein
MLRSYLLNLFFLLRKEATYKTEYKVEKEKGISRIFSKQYNIQGESEIRVLILTSGRPR